MLFRNFVLFPYCQAGASFNCTCKERAGFGITSSLCPAVNSIVENPCLVGCTRLGSLVGSAPNSPKLRQSQSNCFFLLSGCHQHAHESWKSEHSSCETHRKERHADDEICGVLAWLHGVWEAVVRLRRWQQYGLLNGKRVVKQVSIVQLGDNYPQCYWCGL